ncbi:MAG: hypothetical protein ACRYG8_46265 [Janthinobacterium lividum]
MTYTFDGPAWNIGQEWPDGLLPPPTVAVTIGYLELEVLIEDHVISAANAADQHSHDTEMFHTMRASYLRQRLAAVAPHRLTPDRKGNA